MLYIILLLVALVVLGFLIVVALQPAKFRIQRTATFTVTPATVFAQVNDLHLWEAWSPWAKMDPNAKNTFTGPDSGPGASMSWAGNNKVGEGRMTIIESTAPNLVRLKLEFFKPFKATNEAEFTFQSQGGQTFVTWSMTGTNNFMAKAFVLIMNCDKMVGGQFEQGLAGLKTVVEAGKIS